MKTVLIVGDGMTDFPIEALGGQTPLEHLSAPGFAVIGGGETGRVRTCPEGLPPGSDVAFLSLLGNNTKNIYTGRSPLEAAGMGIEVLPGEVAFRMNLVAVTEEGYPNATMLSHNGGGIDGEDALVLTQGLISDPAFEELAKKLNLRIYPTDTFRHVAVMPGDAAAFHLTPPHDLAGRSVRDDLPDGDMYALMRLSFAYLSAHPINKKRREKGLLPANSAWFWGAGTACVLESFEAKYGAHAAAISAVPLVKGIARLNGITVIEVDGATGLLDTNYEGKTDAALNALKEGYDFVLVHLEAPDEMSHDGSLENKLEAMRRLDQRVVQPLLDALPALGEYRVMLMADHYTLLSTRTHDGTPVPYAIYDSRRPGSPRPFTEALCANDRVLENGDLLMKKLFELNS